MLKSDIDKAIGFEKRFKNIFTIWYLEILFLA